MDPSKQIQVMVKYVGNPDWNHKFPPETLVAAVKLEAMTEGFHLEASAAPNYALQIDGADVAEDKPLSVFGKENVKFELVLKKEPHKGV